PSSGRDRLLPRPRSRLLAAVHDRVAGTAGARAGALERCRRVRDDGAGSPRRARPEPVTPLAVPARLRARRGDPGPWTHLDEASTLAAATGELQRLLPVALARAEARWLADQAHLIGFETSIALDLAAAQEQSWGVGELQVWRRRAGLGEPPEPSVAAEP